MGFERAGLQLMWGNLMVFAFVVAITLAIDGFDPTVAMMG